MKVGFGKNFQTTDHHRTCRLIAQKNKGMRTDLWVATVDFQKAFDFDEHAAIWSALKYQSIVEQRVALLKNV